MHIPFSKEQVLQWNLPTPFYIYDEPGIRSTARSLLSAFSHLAFQEYFAVKATPNPYILNLLREEGFGADCSSLPELLLAQRAGITGEKIMFSSNNTAAAEFVKARELGAIINLDDPGHLPFLEHHAGLPEVLSFRYNPGGEGGNAIIGQPQESKFGMRKDQIIASAKSAYEQGVKRMGIHCMLASNSLDQSHFSLEAGITFALVKELVSEGVPIEFVNFGGGVGIPYRPTDKALSFVEVASAINKEYGVLDKCAIPRPRLCMELGRAITGPHGYLITKVRHLKESYKRYVGVDATMANLMRPGMYGSYHHISVLGKEESEDDSCYDVCGSLCENNDKFAIDRPLPKIDLDDILVIHSAGAHGTAMCFNYNGKLRCAEYVPTAGTPRMIRRAETEEDYFATLVF